jgi:SAM-dependent methyltransferase
LPDHDRHVGLIGLGVGTLAAYGRKGDHFRIYEINPDDVRIASTRFSYLSDCPATVDIITGDARLSLERESGQDFDLLALDAFSGDSVPVHLLTQEAFETYLRHLTPKGIIAIHLSNKYIDLFPVILGVINHFQMNMVWIPFWEEVQLKNIEGHSSGVISQNNPLGFGSDWALLTRDPDLLFTPEIDKVSRHPNGGKKEITPAFWTDEHSSILPLLRWF